MQIPVSERRNIPHHLLDVFEPENDFSAGEFYHLARAATEDILARGKTPIVVGGTGFYLRWYLLGKPSTPTSNKQTEALAQQRIEQAWKEKGCAEGEGEGDEAKWAAGVALVRELGDDESADRLEGEFNNYYRLRRVVDILMQAPGRTLKELKLDEASQLPYDFRCYFLYRPRVELYRRIDARVEDMLGGGVLEETERELGQRGMKPNENCATRAIGYRQALDFLYSHTTSISNAITTLDESSIVDLAKAIQAASRRLCHSQLTWFRDDTLFRWIDATQGQSSVVEEILGLWTEPCHEGGGEAFGAGRLSKEESHEMRRYVTKFEKLVKGSAYMDGVVQNARSVVERMRARERETSS